jgi:acyl-ACP thioesterase
MYIICVVAHKKFYISEKDTIVSKFTKAGHMMTYFICLDRDTK